MSAEEARTKLHSLATPEGAAASKRFFKLGPGEYGEGDVFLGVRVPSIRKVAKEFRALPLGELAILIESPIHEQRHLALIILVDQAKKAKPLDLQQIYDFYMQSRKHINNWDLVDVSAPEIVGRYLYPHPRAVLTKLAKSASLWDRRIAIVSTQYFIRNQLFEPTFTLARVLLADDEDLIHKATGWMLREIGDHDSGQLEAFLQECAPQMPRTMLRYAIEKFSKAKRNRYMQMEAENE